MASQTKRVPQKKGPRNLSGGLSPANQFRRGHYMRRARMLSKWFAQCAEDLSNEGCSQEGLDVIAREVERAQSALFYARSDVETRSLLLVDCVIAGSEIIARVQPLPLSSVVEESALRQAMGRLSVVRSDLAGKVDKDLMLTAIKAWKNSGKRADVKKWEAINALARSMGIGVRNPDQIRKDRIRLQRGG